MRKLTISEIKKRIIEVHGNRFDLSKIDYQNRRTKVEVICKEHGSWMTTTEQLFRGQGCPTCGGKVVTEQNSLEVNFPNLFSEWDYNKNNTKPSEIGYGSSKKVWWICPENHSYLMSPKTRTRKGMEQNCPYCSNRRIDSSNSLSSLKPEWVSEWNQNKNKGISPDTIGINSNKKIWWKCSEGHEWFVSPNQRITYNTDCPNCAISGYKTDLEGFFYLHLVIVDSKQGLKYGITNYPENRLSSLKTLNKRQSNYKNKISFKNMFTLKGNGEKVLEMERVIRKDYGRNYFKKSELPHGYTETIPLSEEVPEKIMKHGILFGLEILTSNL